jgi:hypothetical protein
MVRLGRKYELSTLYEEAMRRLRSDFPSDLPAWRKACLKKNRNFKPSKRNLIDIINLAVEQNLLSLLPTAMLALCRRVSLVSRVLLLVFGGFTKIYPILEIYSTRRRTQGQIKGTTASPGNAYVSLGPQQIPVFFLPSAFIVSPLEHSFQLV